MGAVAAVVAVIALACLILLLYRQIRSRNVGDRQPPTELAEPDVSSADETQEPSNPGGPTRIRILFGTQTGTAEKFAKQIGKLLSETYGTAVAPCVEDLETYAFSEKLGKEQYALFLVATYGDGDPTDGAIDYDSWLSDSVVAGEQFLEGLKFGVFALGNTEYEHFCAFGKKVDRVLEELGGERIVKRIDGDDSDCIEDNLEEWSRKLLSALDKQGFGKFRMQNANKEPEVAVPAYDVIYEPQNGSTRHVSSLVHIGTSGGSVGHTVKLATISKVHELHTPESERSCIHVVLDISGNGFTYEHGDHVAVLPENSEEIVSEAAKILGEDLHRRFILRKPKDDPDNLPAPFPGPITLGDALTNFADLTSSPLKSVLPALAAFASSEEEAARLRFLASPEGKEEYKQQVHDNHMSLLELLQEFPSVKPPLGAFFATVCPRLQPRYYSISSSPKMHPDQIHITATVVDELKPSGRQHKGVCTNWLKHQEVGSFAPIHVRKSHFRLPPSPSTPIIMVGPGAGLAPFRGFLQERAVLKGKGEELGPALLFFGCRDRKKDYIYEQELRKYLSDGVLTGLHVAFSREKSEKDYVQHHLLREREKVWSMLNGEQKGSFYVCGDAAHMAKDVQSALRNIIQQCKCCSGIEAELMVRSLHDQGRYQKDVW